MKQYSSVPHTDPQMQHSTVQGVECMHSDSLAFQDHSLGAGVKIMPMHAGGKQVPLGGKGNTGPPKSFGIMVCISDHLMMAYGKAEIPQSK